MCFFVLLLNNLLISRRSHLCPFHGFCDQKLSLVDVSSIEIEVEIDTSIPKFKPRFIKCFFGYRDATYKSRVYLTCN